jgi:hypothetical protein
MYFSINRKIFKYLNEDLRKEYVYEIILKENSTNDMLNYEEEAKITNAIIEIINKNEEWHEKFGIERKNGLKQVAEDCLVPGESEVSGYYHLGNLLIAPCDWSWDDNGDFDYSFEIYQKFNSD